MSELAPGDPRHGTETGYGNHKCRCSACREAHTLYHRRYMRENPEQRKKARQREAKYRARRPRYLSSISDVAEVIFVAPHQSRQREAQAIVQRWKLPLFWHDNCCRAGWDHKRQDCLERERE